MATTDSPTSSSNPVERPKQGAALEGVTLESMLNALVERHGWEALGQQIEIRCFTTDPSIRSSLKFLRKTPWARQKVEQLYLALDAART